MSRHRFLTPNLSTLAEAKDCRTVKIPGNLWPLLSGALLELTYSYNWEQFGDATPDETADFFNDVLGDFLMSQCAYVGELRPFSFSPPPDKWLPLDGTAVAQADYPLLTAVCPASWLSGGNINLPDMTAAALVGSGSGYTNGATGGSETHTLDISEIPAHTHSYELAIVSTDILGELPAPSVNAIAPSATGSTGGGSAHNNMPPYLVVNWCIYAGE